MGAWWCHLHKAWRKDFTFNLRLDHPTSVWVALHLTDCFTCVLIFFKKIQRDFLLYSEVVALKVSWLTSVPFHTCHSIPSHPTDYCNLTQICALLSIGNTSTAASVLFKALTLAWYWCEWVLPPALPPYIAPWVPVPWPGYQFFALPVF